jgi:formylglycine-generating enzyme required for sulfatase activity/mono/diheme cytochrome c family protein
MPHVSKCPALADYRRLLGGELPAQEVERLSRHVEQCARCVALVQTIQDGDSLDEALHDVSDGDVEVPRGRVVEALIDRVCGLLPVHNTPPGEASGLETLPTPPPGAGDDWLDFLAPPQQDDEIGRLGPYRVLKVLGAGGMGVVFLAHEPALNRHVALKTMRKDVAAGDSARQRFLREAQATAAIEHDHIVAIHRVDEDRGIPYIAMPLLQGETLEDRLQRDEPVPTAEVVRIGREVAEGLAAAHERGLIHRDVKPANIWLEKGRGRVKLLDFGLARPAGDELHLTPTGAAAGTPLYMAPEVAARQKVDHRCDLYGLGCVLYRMCTGIVPSPGIAGPVIVRALAAGAGGSLRPPPPEVPKPLAELIRALLAWNPADRPQDARAVVRALEASEHKAVPKSRPRPAGRGWPRVAVACACLVALAVGLTAAGLLWFPPKPGEPGPGKPDRAWEDPALAAKAQKIFRANCYSCHGQDGTIEGGLNYILDVKKLVARKKVVPGEPDRSPLYRRLTSPDDPMPPADEKVRPGKEDIALLERWIKAGAPDPGAAAPREWVSSADFLKAVFDDLGTLKEGDQRSARYFTITHLYNAGLSEDELQTHRHGLAKLLNSLSWVPEVVRPQPIDKAQTIFRIDLRDYDWTPQLWERLLARYPFGVTRDTRPFPFIATDTGTALPFVRADWFVHEASRPPLYHELLKLPAGAADLEKQLQVDVQADIDSERVARAGFNISGVAQNNRLLERHPMRRGAYWKSYDFADSVGRQNLFAHPLGPEPEKNAFRHDGGEIIFSLPNGLQGYFLVDAGGKRLDQAPARIVTDRKHPSRPVLNGISCMNCHARGMIDKADEIRAHVRSNPRDFSRTERDVVLALYPPKEQFAELLRKDAERFRRAVNQTLGKPAEHLDDPLPETEPIAALATLFEQPLDRNAVAAELGVSADEFFRHLERAAPQTRASLGALKVEGGTIGRQVFEASFPDVVEALELGKFFRAAEEVAVVKPPPPPSVRGPDVINSVGMKFVRIPAGKFRMGSPEDEKGRGADEQAHDVEITKSFHLGIYEVTQGEYEVVMGKNPSGFSAGGRKKEMVKAFKDTRRFPVEQVSWDNAVDFCEKLSARPEEKAAGRKYRLPTEAEWEYACRGGADEQHYSPFHFGPSLSSEQANFGDVLKRTTTVGSYPPNAFGLYDMHGNVAEWCADSYDEDFYKAGPRKDPRRDERPGDTLKRRVLRGGSWSNDGERCRAAARLQSPPGYAGGNAYGFRVILIAP